MDSPSSTGPETMSGRRSALKKMGKAGMFVIPAIATFKLTELSVRASGFTSNPIDSAWTTYWSRNRRFLLQSQQFWGRQKERWYSIWSFMYKKGWL